MEMLFIANFVNIWKTRVGDLGNHLLKFVIDPPQSVWFALGTVVTLSHPTEQFGSFPADVLIMFPVHITQFVPSP